MSGSGRMVNGRGPALIGRLAAPLLAVVVSVAAFGFGAPAAMARAWPRSQRVLVPGLPYQPVWVAADRRGDVYISSDGDDTISEIRAGTDKTSTILWGLKGVAGLTVDRAGNIFFATGGGVDELRAGTSTPVPVIQGLNEAIGVAVDSRGDVFAADFYGAGKVEELKRGSVNPITLPLTNPQPMSIATDAAGNLYVFEYSGHIAEIAAGSTTPQILPFTFGVDSGGTVDAAGNIFATNSFECTVTEYAAGSWTPTALPFGNDGCDQTSIAVDARDDVFAPDGGLYEALELRHGSAGPIGLGSALSIGPVATDSMGDAFFAAQQLTSDSSGNTTSAWLIEEISRHGHETVRYTGPDQVFGLAVDRSGNLYFVTDGSGVQVLAPGATAPTTLFGSSISGATAVAVDNAGDIFVVEGYYGPVVEIKAGTTEPLTLPFPQLYGAQDIAVDAAGDVFVSLNAASYEPSSILELPAGSQSVTTLPVPGLSGIEGIATDPAGDLVIASTGTNQIGYLAHGSVTPVILPFTGLISPESVAIDGHGDVFETDFALGLSELTGPLSGDSAPSS
jgi:streptogramin lyase